MLHKKFKLVMKHKECKCKPCTCGKEVICKCAERLKKLKEKLKSIIK